MPSLDLNSIISRFCRHFNGNVTIIFALSVIPLMLFAGFAVDFLRASQSQTQLQAALDAAVLAVARAEGLSNSQRIARGTEYFRNNFEANGYEGTARPQFKIEKDRIIGKVQLTLPTTLLKLTGNDNWELTTTAEAMRPTAGTAEVVMVLDYSGSMNDNNKYGRMATVANGFINGLSKDLSSLAQLQFGLVPFSDVVAFLDFPPQFIREDVLALGEWEKDGSGNWYRDNEEPPVKSTYPKDRIGPGYSGCTQDRRHPFNQSDATPGINDEQRKWGEIYHWWDNRTDLKTTAEHCADFLKAGLHIEPLTTNYNKLTSRISAMRPSKNTNIALGVEFGRHLLAPGEPFAAMRYDQKGNRKFLVVLTDGMETTKGRGPGQVESIPNAIDNLSINCERMKTDGITIFAIGYDITDPAITTVLNNCASPGFYYNANVAGSDLQNTFKEIADAIKESLVYLSD